MNFTSFKKNTEKISKSKLPAKFVFIMVGAISTVWFLIRVIPKPSRATYPCIRTAAPFMSAFVIYLLGLFSSIVAYKRAKSYFLNARYLLGAIMLVIALVIASLTFSGKPKTIYASSVSLIEPNVPVGVARGIFPGRVVWAWNPDATNENCSNEFGDAWDLPQNTDVNRVDAMCSDAVNKLVETTSSYAAWDTLFRHFNEKQGKGAVPYAEGEKIFIKMNFVGGHRDRLDDNHARIEHIKYGNAQASPQIGLAILRQLINDYGVAQEDVSFGDPSKCIYKNGWDMWTAEFPNVNYIAESDEMGRTMAVPGENPVVFYSDKGTVLGGNEDYLCSALEEADYLINISGLKGHEIGGITLNAKNHYGSHMRDKATHLHPGLVGYRESSRGYGKYRSLVDIMGHKHLGEKTLLFVIDGLWAGYDANLPPVKWSMTPFDNDFTSSIFVSQDHVAMEAVCYDFLKAEYTVENAGDYAYPQMEGTDDYLLQAADSAYWPDNFIYDPENDGTPIASMGVYEQWNNTIDKAYSRNLGTGNGIELVKIFYVSSPDAPSNVNIELIDDNAATLSWDLNSANTSHYCIEESIGNKNSFVQIAMVDSTVSKYNVSGAYHIDMLYYRIIAINKTDTSAYSQTVELTTAIPSAPTKLKGEVIKNNQVSLTWEDESMNVQYYAIEQSYNTSSNFVAIDTITADSTACIIYDLEPLSYYYFRIKGLNGKFESAFSNIAAVLTGDFTNIQNNFSENLALHIYPNPTRGACKVTLNNSYAGFVQLNVFNNIGIKVKDKQLFKDQEKWSSLLEMHDLAEGVYIVELKCGNSVYTNKIYVSE